MTRIDGSGRDAAPAPRAGWVPLACALWVAACGGAAQPQAPARVPAARPAPDPAPGAPEPGPTFAELDVPVPLDATGRGADEVLGELLSGTWSLRVWQESAPNLVVTGTLHCERGESELGHVFIDCEWRAFAEGSDEPTFYVRYFYMSRGGSLYAVRVERGHDGVALYEPEARFVEQTIPIDGRVAERVRIVFDAEHRQARFRFSQVDRDMAEIDDSRTVRGELVKRERPTAEAATPPSVEAKPIDIDECVPRRTRDAGKPVLEVDLAGDLVLRLPGRPKEWVVECGTEETRTPFRAVREQGDRLQVVTLEVANLLPPAPFDASRWAFRVGSLEALRGASTFQDFTLDLGELPLPGSHFARLTFARRPDAGGTLHGIHGFAPRRLSSTTDVVLHVSETADEPGRERVEEILRGLRDRSP